jgi:hypothetical protein
MRGIKYLSKKTFERYGDRKKPGLITFLIDVDKESIYPVPKGMEHVGLACILAKTTRFVIETDPKVVSHLIPSTLEIKEGLLVSVLTGVSGLELGFKVKHKKGDLRKAHRLIWACITLSEEVGTIKIEELKRNKIIFSK